MVEPQDPLQLVWAILSSIPNTMSARKTLKTVIPVKIIDRFGAIEYTQFLDYPTYRAIHNPFLLPTITNSTPEWYIF